VNISRENFIIKYSIIHIQLSDLISKIFRLFKDTIIFNWLVHFISLYKFVGSNSADPGTAGIA